MKHLLPWIVFALLLLMLPWLFPSVLGISILNEMAIAIVFALSYNMLLGQGGMLSFGHAVYFGLGGFMAAHALLGMELGGPIFSVTLIPLVAGGFGLLAAVLIGSFSTRRAGTAFAMISLGVGELLAALALILVSFFGGEAGISGDRSLGPAFLGADFAQDSQVYALAAVWTFVSTLAMYLFTQTPAGRMANAVRDNPERAAFLGYNVQRVRLLSFIVSGFFAGVAGGLFALHYEILTAQNLSTTTSGNVLLMSYIGGVGFFTGPMIGAVVLTLINSVLSHYTELWLLYLGLSFVLTVMFLPQGLTGLLMMHRTPWRRGRLRSLLRPYLLTGIPATLCLFSVFALLEMLHQGSGSVMFFGLALNTEQPWAWLGALLLAIAAAYGWRRSLPSLREAWRSASQEDAP
ncbi:MAG: branched-chain amino acid ABC transporter permease [Pseudomonadales bacterium]|nr:branched-chain amino acid ABC transporter permease [Pseudomonadales bacterium]MCP5358475.1 branched-chain amino acid ABC transporter permease [Pseudomonadales bacterium]